VEVVAVSTKMHQANGYTTLADALQAHDDGAFETCLALCNTIHARDDATKIEVALLRARAYIRLDRGDRALEALRKSAFMVHSLDQHIATQLLTGTAYVRLGQKERGEGILSATTARAKPANPLIRAELSLQHGIAKFRLGAYDAADQLFSDVHPESDIVHAQALEYRGWVAQARGNFQTAAQFFRDALARLAACRRRDRCVEVKALYGLTALSAELLLPEEWPLIERRLQRCDWSSGGVVRWRFWIDLAASMMCETTGDIAGALRWARHAEQAADGEDYRIVALCRLAAVLRGLREINAHAELVEYAHAAYDTLDLRDLGADLQSLPLYLAEEMAYTSAPDATEDLLAQYREVVLPATKSSSGDVDRYLAMARSIEAALLEAGGEPAEAVEAFAWSFNVLADFGYRRRATAIALRLARLTGEKSYTAYAERALRGTSPLFWMTRELAELRSGPGPSLTAAETAILGLLVQGKTYKEIAVLRSASVKTIDNHVQALFRKFGLHSRGELAAQALRRGIVTLHGARPEHE
jgi:DNA-binding CsgD family transcriptional regulator